MKHKKSRAYLLTIIILTAVPFLALLVKLDINKTYDLFTILGSVAGFLGTVLIFWQFILGIPTISSIFTTDTVWLNKLHKFLGKYGIILFLIHPILKTYTYYGSLNYLFKINLNAPLSDINLGRYALSLIVLLWVTSALFRSKLTFRAWKKIHFISYPILILTFFHARRIGTYLSSNETLYTYWNILMFATFIFVVYRILIALGIFRNKFTLVSKQKHGDVFVYDFRANNKMLYPKPGQYAYITINRFGESHPFTISEVFENERKIRFSVKATGPFTSKLSKLEVGKSVFIDGPFGVFTLEGQNELPKVIIAGGIGVTPFISLVDKFSNKDTYMFYSNRSLKQIFKGEFFKKILGERYFDVVTNEPVKDKNIINEIPNESTFKEKLPKEIMKEANFFICGPQAFNNYYKDLLISLGVNSNRIFFEDFSF